MYIHIYIYLYVYMYSSVTHNIVIHELMCWVCRRCDDDAILFAIFELQPRLMSALCDGCMVCQRKRARIWACMYTIACMYVSRRLTLHTHKHTHTHTHTYTHLACMQETHTVYTHTQIHIHTWHTCGRLTVHRQTDRQTDTRHTCGRLTVHRQTDRQTDTHTYTNLARRRTILHKNTHIHAHTHTKTHTHTHTPCMHPEDS